MFLAERIPGKQAKMEQFEIPEAGENWAGWRKSKSSVADVWCGEALRIYLQRNG